MLFKIEFDSKISLTNDNVYIKKILLDHIRACCHLISDNVIQINLELENDEIGPGFCASQRGEEPFYILGPDGYQYINILYPQFWTPAPL